MSRALRILGCLTAVMAIAVAANAATLNLNLVTHQTALGDPAGTWELWASTSSGDNDGIAGYNIEMLNSDSTDHNIIAQGVPLPPPLSPVLATGFTINDATNDVLFGGQNSTDIGSIWYGVGSPDFTVTESEGLTNFGAPATGESFAPVMLASGTGDYTAVSVGSASGNVWSLGASPDRGSTTDAESADVVISTRRVPVIPEPTALMLLGLAATAIFARRSR